MCALARGLVLGNGPRLFGPRSNYKVPVRIRSVGSGAGQVELRTRKHERTKGAGSGRAPRAARASRQAGPRRNRENAKARRLRKGRLERRVRVSGRVQAIVCGLPAGPAHGAHGKAHKNKRSEPTTDSEPARTRSLSRVSLFFRAFAIQPAPTLPSRLARHTGSPPATAPVRAFVFSCAAVAQPCHDPR